MKLLLDTHVVLWWVRDDRRLGRQARRAIATAESDLSGVRKHTLLDSVQSALKEAQSAVKSGY